MSAHGKPDKTLKVILLPSQEFEDYEREAALAYAKAINHLDYAFLESWLDENTVYESQYVMTPMVGRECILEYLKGKFITISQAGTESKVTAEMAYMNATYEGRPVVILNQGGHNVAVVLFKAKHGRIARIDICGILPRVEEATGTGEFPS